MEEEIQDKINEIYNNYIRIEVNKYNDKFYKENNFEIYGHIKIRKDDTISLGFNFIYNYDKKLTLDVNIYYITKEIDMYITKLFKEE